MKKFYITAIREIKGRNRRIHRKVPARNIHEAIKNCSYRDEIISCEPIQRTRHCIRNKGLSEHREETI